jgi:hypothetical protein
MCDKCLLALGNIFTFLGGFFETLKFFDLKKGCDSPTTDDTNERSPNSIGKKLKKKPITAQKKMV